MNKKIVFFDIDGTIIDIPSGMDKPLESTVRAIEQLKANGHYSVIATARAKVPEMLAGIDFDGFIFCNGNYIEFQDEIIYDNFFSTEQVDYLAELCNQYQGHYVFSGHLGAWTSSITHPLVLRQVELFGSYTPSFKGNIVDWEAYEVHANMVTALFNTEEQLYECKSKLPGDWVVDAYNTGNIRMDIHLPGFTKGRAVQHLYQKLGIATEDTFAFGDAKNDIEMIKLVKHGIAMGNGTDEIKAIAYEVTDGVANDGIYNALKRYMLI
jgi:Cof subfamily protein (haloacid dehalogenase superfamily)